MSPVYWTDRFEVLFLRHGNGERYSTHETDFDFEVRKKSFPAKTIIITAVILLVCITISWIFPLSIDADNHYPNGDTIVRVTRTGGKYHYSFCSYLQSSSIKITLEEAVSRGYGSCSRCDPPSYISFAEYQQAKDTQNYIVNIILALIASIPTALLSYLIALFLSAFISRFLSLLDDLPDWIFTVSALVTYITVLIREIKEFIIW